MVGILAEVLIEVMVGTGRSLTHWPQSTDISFVNGHTTTRSVLSAYQ